jgi:hypothetical protein
LKKVAVTFFALYAHGDLPRSVGRYVRFHRLEVAQRSRRIVRSSGRTLHRELHHLIVADTGGAIPSVRRFRAICLKNIAAAATATTEDVPYVDTGIISVGSLIN